MSEIRDNWFRILGGCILLANPLALSFTIVPVLFWFTGGGLEHPDQNHLSFLFFAYLCGIGLYGGAKRFQHYPEKIANTGALILVLSVVAGLIALAVFHGIFFVIGLLFCVSCLSTVFGIMQFAAMKKIEPH